MKKYLLGAVFVLTVTVILLSLWRCVGKQETKEIAFTRVVISPMPPSVWVKEYWPPVGIGGDGLCVFSFDIDWADLVKLLRSTDYQLETNTDLSTQFALKVEIENVEFRIKQKVEIPPHCLHYYLYTNGIQKHIIFNITNRVPVILWTRPGPSI